MREPVRRLNGDLIGWMENDTFIPVEAMTEFGSGSRPSTDSGSEDSPITPYISQTMDSALTPVEGSNGTKFHCGILSLDSTQSNQQLIPEPKSTVDVPQPNSVVATPRPDSVVAPAPVEDELDDLLLECAKAILMRPALRVHSMLKPYGTGMQSPWLWDEMTVWVTRGNLRDVQQVNAALTEYIEWANRLAALGVLDGWTLDLPALKRMRFFFQVPDSRPLPTKKQYLAEQAAFEQERREARERHVAADRRAAREAEERQRQYEASEEGKRARVIQDAVTIIVGEQTLADPEKPTVDEVMTARLLAEERTRVTPYVEAVAKLRPLATSEDIAVRWRAAQTEYAELAEMLEGTPQENQIVKEEDFTMKQVVKELGPPDLEPLKAGETREFYRTWQDFLADFTTNSAKWMTILDTHDFQQQLQPDGHVAVTFMPKGRTAGSTESNPIVRQNAA
jgi:hypothetical protein